MHFVLTFIENNPNFKEGSVLVYVLKSKIIICYGALLFIDLGAASFLSVIYIIQMIIFREKNYTCFKSAMVQKYLQKGLMF